MTTDAFSRLAPAVRKWVRAQGWREMRPIQVRTTGAILGDDADLVVAAGTAGGKTEAAFLPLVSQVLLSDRAGQGFDILYIGPLKALITDQARRIADICRETDLPVVPWHGDVNAAEKRAALARPGGVLLITPESLEALCIRKGPAIAGLFGRTRAVVIDELHSLLGSERGVQLQSLIHRVEQARGRRLRRIGLSATLGDIGLACSILNPDAPGAVVRIEGTGGAAELRVGVRALAASEDDESQATAFDQVADSLFRHLRGSNNLVFAGSRARVELYADRLRERCEKAHLPQEFYPHHASLSRDHRDFVEDRLRDGRLPTTAICTSTLELGIDIGDVACVAQIGAPFSVASLRQRLGRSGRRAGQPAVLRQYLIEARSGTSGDMSDRLHLNLVRAIAMIELLGEGWCEPPDIRALHLSTLVHQILSVIAQAGGARAAELHRLLCRTGPFRAVDAALFRDVLRAIGEPGRDLVEQASDGTLLLGAVGEKLVEHYGFYAVFQTEEEYRLLVNGAELGTMPVTNVPARGMMLIFSGRRWTVLDIHDRERAILLAPATGGRPPIFGGDVGAVHDRVVARMFDILSDTGTPAYLDAAAAALLAEARAEYRLIFAGEHPIALSGESSWVLATRRGTVATSTLALALQARGWIVLQHDGILELRRSGECADPTDELRGILDCPPDPGLLPLSEVGFEKFHPWLSPELIRRDLLSSRLDPGSLHDTCTDVLSRAARGQLPLD